MVGKDQLYIENKYGSRFLYALDDRSKTNRLEQSLSLADSMAAYARRAPDDRLGPGASSRRLSWKIKRPWWPLSSVNVIVSLNG